MKAAVITFPGSNCDDDLVFTLRKSGEFEVETLWHKDSPDLKGFDLVCLPGGFSYGDYLRCGSMASLSPVMQQVKTFAKSGGFVLGICNGFQILCESGLLPGALTRNSSLLFSCKDVGLKVESNDSPWTNECTANEMLLMPIAHGDGRYIVDELTYRTLKANGQVLLSYVAPSPNGSSFDIAGVCNETKNVFGLMPHPERATDLRTRDGIKIWKSIKKSISSRSHSNG